MSTAIWVLCFKFQVQNGTLGTKLDTRFILCLARKRLVRKRPLSECFLTKCSLRKRSVRKRFVDYLNQGHNARKVNCSRVYPAYIWKPVLSGRNL